MEMRTHTGGVWKKDVGFSESENVRVVWAALRMISETIRVKPEEMF